ncbi:MAG: hypothetical protein ACLSA2_02140 [Candidatus Gastranaerophilaceae bacterium]
MADYTVKKGYYGRFYTIFSYIDSYFYVFIQHRIFVTPEQLEKKHREIIEEIEEKFVTINSFKDLKDQFSEVKEKIDKMYDLLIDLK